jgi:hypothetical protein
MKTYLIIFFALNWVQLSLAQILIQGKITDTKGEALIGANVFLKNTFDGASTDTTGAFSFKTTETTQDTLVVSFVGYIGTEQKINLQNAQSFTFKLKEEATALNMVVITAGTFEASDEKRMTILKPLDIVRTAGSNGDIFGALQTLPGAQRVGESEGMFVRGGSAGESKTLIDGMIVQNPFFSSIPDVQTRSRFSPFLFKGTAFSTGGYSAQYGQALSSVLSLQSEDLPKETNLNLFLSHLTWSATATKRRENTSVALSGNYTNVALANALVPQNVDWIHPYSGWGASAIVRHKFKEGDLLKFFSNYGRSRVALKVRDFEGNLSDFDMRNDNVYNNLYYQNNFGKWTLQSGVSYSYNQDNILLDTDKVKRQDDRLQARLVLKHEILENSSILFGSEIHQYHFENGFNEFLNQLDETYSAGFAEAEIYITRKLAGRVGARAEYSAVLNRWNIAPRVSLAYKTAEYSQVSFAFGEFYQNPETPYLYQNSDLKFEKSIHYILNYQWLKGGYTFRTEAFYKDYQSLVRELDNSPFNPDPNRRISGNTNNTGFGYATGIDVFWRDKKTIKNADYWISYSYIDTERLFQNYTQQAIPTFVSEHNLNVVYKHFFPKINLDFNLTYSYASGRPYYNPNSDDFLSDLTPDFHNLSLALNYLVNFLGTESVVIFSVNNVLNRENVFGYRYSDAGNQRVAVNPPAFRSFFVGISMTLK